MLIVNAKTLMEEYGVYATCRRQPWKSSSGLCELSGLRRWAGSRALPVRRRYLPKRPVCKRRGQERRMTVHLGRNLVPLTP